MLVAEVPAVVPIGKLAVASGGEMVRHEISKGTASKVCSSAPGWAGLEGSMVRRAGAATVALAPVTGCGRMATTSG